VAFRLHRDARLVHFASADGVRLEGRLTVVSPNRGALPDRDAGRARGVVLCHPHPLYGGSMLSPVVLTAEQAFREAGWTTLAFNFRGVGGSRGTHDEGVAEQGDVTGALDALVAALAEGSPASRTSALGPSTPGPPDPRPSVLESPAAGAPATQPASAAAPVCAIAGYSFGSLVGAQVAAQDRRVTFYLGIAPVLDRRDFGFLRSAHGRLAFIGATRDQFCAPARLEALVATLPGPPWLRFVEADHFFADALDDLAAACRDAIAWAT